MKLFTLPLIAFLSFVTSGDYVPYVATAYCLHGRMANGEKTHPGVVAADPRILPLGTRIHIKDGPLPGYYVVSDTGGGVKGRRIDIYVSSKTAALKFGRQKVQVSILK